MFEIADIYSLETDSPKKFLGIIVSGRVDKNYQDFTKKLNPYRAPPSIQKRTIYVPLNFWFCQYTGQCLPLVALQYHDIEIVLLLKKKKY